MAAVNDPTAENTHETCVLDYLERADNLVALLCSDDLRRFALLFTTTHISEFQSADPRFAHLVNKVFDYEVRPANFAGVRLKAFVGNSTVVCCRAPPEEKTGFLGAALVASFTSLAEYGQFEKTLDKFLEALPGQEHRTAAGRGCEWYLASAATNDTFMRSYLRRALPLTSGPLGGQSFRLFHRAGENRCPPGDGIIEIALSSGIALWRAAPGAARVA